MIWCRHCDERIIPSAWVHTRTQLMACDDAHDAAEPPRHLKDMSRVERVIHAAVRYVNSGNAQGDDADDLKAVVRDLALPLTLPPTWVDDYDQMGREELLYRCKDWRRLANDRTHQILVLEENVRSWQATARAMEGARDRIREARDDMAPLVRHIQENGDEIVAALHTMATGYRDDPEKSERYRNMASRLEELLDDDDD